MGFPDVYDYTAGKADWIAMGQPTVWRDALPRIESVARKDVPVCAPHESLQSVRGKLPKDWNVCVVLDAEGIVLGLTDFSRDVEKGELISDIMLPAPLTFRPGQPVKETCEALKARNVQTALVTKSTGEFIGVLRRDDLCA
jgi:Mg/Co/Ni transporter MgtE